MFNSTKNSLSDLLTDIDQGKMQLPDFQRGWVWDDERIRGLIASLCVGYPIGAVMLLQTGGNGVRFKPRPVSGSPANLKEVEPETLILDGQQRFTSMYQVLKGVNAVSTKDARGKALKRWYYVDMKAAMESPDVEDAIVSVPEDKMVKSDFGRRVVQDLTTPEKEYESCFFPVNVMFDSSPWRRGFNAFWGQDAEKADLFDEFEKKVIESFKGYQVPVIELTKETPKEAVCLVFEKVNTGGVSLTVFELLTASFAADNFHLRDDWRDRERRLKDRYPVLAKLQSDDFLQAISLLATLETRRRFNANGDSESSRAPAISCKRKDLLKLTTEQYLEWADRVESGFEKAAKFLHSQKIFRAKDVPYRTQVVPLAAILEDLGHDGETDGAKSKIKRWFWSGVLGELYGGAIESRFARDLPEVAAMVRGHDVEPITITEASFSANRLKTLRTRNSAAYKGLHALLMRDGCLDFLTGHPVEAATFYDEPLDIHHIFPQAWCQEQGVEDGWYNSIVNKTAITARTNRMIGKSAPSDYLVALQERGEFSFERMQEFMRSHRIDPATMRSDDFWGFFAQRAESLLQMIEDVMGKEIQREEGLFGPDSEVQEEYVQEEEGWE